MRAVTWQGNHDVSVETVPDPQIEHPTDGGAAHPMPLIQMFDKQLNVRMGQANVRRWTEDILPLLSGDGDPLGVDDFATHRLPLEEAPHAYEIFQKKEDGAFKILLQP